MSNIILHRANTRGFANHGWLKAYHSFSFAGYYNPKRIHFGALRVLNDDTVQGGMGFGEHPHDNMEIITVMLSGALEHRDSMGNIGVIQPNEVQIMSAGTGIQHAEYNHNRFEALNLLQLWIFPKIRNVSPRYDQKSFAPDGFQNQFVTMVGPQGSNAPMYIHQDAYISRGQFSAGQTATYTIQHPGNGAYIFVINGDLTIGEHTLNKRDALGLWEINDFSAQILNDADLLVIEVPQFNQA